MSEYQGEKFRAFIKKVKEDYKKYGYTDRPTNENLADALGVSSVQLNRYYKSKSLGRDSVNKIVTTFKVSEEEIWGDDLSKSNAKPARLLGDGTPNMWDVTIKAQGGFLEGYGDTILLEQNVEKVYFPFFKGECFSFEVEGLSMVPEYMPGDRFISTPIENFNHLVKGRTYVFQTIDGI